MLKGLFFVTKSSDLAFIAARVIGHLRMVFRCAGDLEKHFEESVLLKLPETYQSVLKQSLISEADDMGTHT